MKTCYKCNIEKDDSAFHVSATTKDGLQGMCKTCKKSTNKLKLINDDTENQLIIEVDTARERLRKYRIDRAIQEEMETQVAKAAIEDFRKKLDSSQAGGVL